MNTNLLKKLAGSSAILGLALSAFAGPLPSGTSPTLAPIPAGLNPLGPDYPTPSGTPGVPVAVGEELFASGGPVYVTDLGPTGASFDEQIFMASPDNGVNNLFMDNHSTPNGTTFYLGTFAAGTEIEFGLDILAGVQNIWYDGPGSRNADGVVHAYMVNNYEGLADTTYVGFEDEAFPGGDFNYIDERYAFTGVGAQNAPDASSTMPLLGMGVTALACFARRFRK
jgi:hypothetical protein